MLAGPCYPRLRQTVGGGGRWRRRRWGTATAVAAKEYVASRPPPTGVRAGGKWRTTGEAHERNEMARLWGGKWEPAEGGKG